MSGKVKEKTKAQTQKEPCRHYWVIEVANGPVSCGQCKYCGVRKEFFNAFPEYNPLKKNANPLGLPELSGVKVEEDSKS
jgi:7-cyano-7-deazaguanine synthase in queuosine biosynthesis